MDRQGAIGVPYRLAPECRQGEGQGAVLARQSLGQHELRELRRAQRRLQKEVRNGYVQWCANRAELEQEVGALHLAKIAVVVDGTKVRLIHDLRRNGTNARVTFWERLALPRVKDLITGIMELFQKQTSGEGVELLTLDFRDAFKQLHVVPSAMDGFFSYRTVLFGVGSGPLCVVQGGCVGHAQHPSVVGSRQSPDQLLC